MIRCEEGDLFLPTVPRLTAQRGLAVIALRQEPGNNTGGGSNGRSKVSR